MNRRVVVTGIGPVTSIGIGKQDFWDHLLSGVRPEVRTVPQTKANTKSQVYIPFPEFRLSDHGISSYYDFLQREDKLAVLGSKLALEDAGYEINADGHNFSVNGGPEVSVVIGIGFTGLETAFHSYLAHLGVDYRPEHMDRKLSFNRMVIPLLMNNSPAAWTSILFGFKGESSVTSASCASGTAAVGQAFRRIRDGYSDIVLTGGVENLCDESFAVFRGFAVLGALTKSPTGDAQPFSEDRSGFLFAEGGGCMLVLEELSHAQKRDAEIYAELLDYHANSDAHSILFIEPSGERILDLFSHLAGNQSIDYLNAHGTATPINDQIEAELVIRFFGDAPSQPIINSTKGILGHTIGASGAIEAAVTALSIHTGRIHSNLVQNPISNLNLAAGNLARQIERALSVSYGFGGHNAGLLLGRYHG